MNIYMILVKAEPGSTQGPWDLDSCVFETQETAVTWAEANLTGKTWRLVMIPVSVLR